MIIFIKNIKNRHRIHTKNKAFINLLCAYGIYRRIAQIYVRCAG